MDTESREESDVLQNDEEFATESTEILNSSPDINGRSRILFCRKCDGHGKQVLLKGHAPKCPYNLCSCPTCAKLMTKRLKSFKKRNKSRLEAAAVNNAQKRMAMSDGNNAILLKSREIVSSGVGGGGGGGGGVMERAGFDILDRFW